LPSFRIFDDHHFKIRSVFSVFGFAEFSSKSTVSFFLIHPPGDAHGGASVRPMSTILQMPSAILLTVKKSNVSADKRMTNAHPSFRNSQNQSPKLLMEIVRWESQVIEKPESANWQGPCLIRLP